MRSDVAPAARAVVGLAFLLGGPALAQDASLDRANLEAAAGRRVFENVLLADPQAFARRTPVGSYHARYAVIGSSRSPDRVSLSSAQGLAHNPA